MQETDKGLVAALGLMGFAAGAACVVFELYTVTKERKRRRGQSQSEQPGTVAREELVEVLGVEGTPNQTIIWVGLAGAIALLVAGLIELASIAFRRSNSTGDGQAGSTSGSLGQPGNIGAEERLSLSNIEENMTVAGLV